MDTGLLWFDDNPKLSLAAKVENAARRYRERFGRCADVCYVHPQTLLGAMSMPDRVQVIALSTIRPDHFWVGVKAG